MADSEGIGFSIEIPDKVFKDLQKVDTEIAKLQTTADNTAKSIVGSFKMMADGVNPFIERLKQANNGIVNIPSTLSLAANSGNSFSNSINKATVSLSQFATYWEKIQNNPRLFSQMEKNDTKAQLNELKQTWNELQNVSRQITQANREMALLAKQAAANTRIESQRVTTETKKKIAEYKREEAQLRLNNAAYNNYIRAMSMSEQTVNSRTKKIERLKNVMAELAKEESKYSKEIEAIKNKMAALAKENTNVEKSLGKVSERHRSLMNTSDQLARKLALVFSISQIQGYLNNLINVRGEFEKQNAALAAILQNKDEADKLFNQITELAVKSPFTVRELTRYTKELSAYRVETEKLFDTTKMLADISAGLGVDMSRLILAYGQVKAANYLRGSELRQFSEAGVNILGELSKYFTELEGNIVSVGDVFERVTKRMVTFGDVEEIFKRLTSAGGIFYNMQEIQSETLSGQISNLRDALDLMFNDIGKANDGVIKSGVKTVKQFIENWRELAWYLEKAASGFILIKTYSLLASLGTSKLARQLGITLVMLKNGGRASDALSTSMKSLSNAARGLGLAFAAAVPIAVIVGLTEVWRIATKTQRELEDLNEDLQSIYSQDTSGLKMQERAFLNLVNRLKDVNKGSQEHRDIISKLNANYGEYLGYIVDETTSYDKLAASIDSVSQALRRKAMASTYEKALSTVYEKTQEKIVDSHKALREYLQQNIKVGGLDYSATEDEIDAIFSLFQKKVEESEEGLFTAVQFNELLSEFYGKQVEGMMTNTSALAKLSDAILLRKEQELEIDKQINDQYKVREFSTREGAKAFKELEEQKKKALADAKELEGTSPLEYQKLVEKINKEFQENKIKLQVDYEGLDKSVAEYRIKLLDWASNTVKDVNSKLSKLSNIYDEGVVRKFLIDQEEASTGLTQIIKNTISQWESQSQIIEQQNKLKAAGTDFDEKLLKAAEQNKAVLEEKIKLLGAEDEINKNINNRNKSQKDVYKEQVNLIKKVGEEYNKLRQYMGDTEATTTLRLNYEEAFDQAGIGDLFATMSFDSSGIVEALKKIIETGGTEASKVAQKALAEIQDKLALEVKIKSVDNLSNELDNMFAQYDFGKELEKLGIGKELGKQFFGVDAFDLDELKKNLESYKKSLGELGEKQAEEFEKAEKKVTEMQRKENEERLKRYVGYLKQSVSERLKIEMQAQKDLAKLEEEDVFDQATKDKIRNSIEIEKNKALDALSWREFQSSDMYISMFEDLERNSSKSLEIMLEKLNQLKGSLNNLNVTELKDVTSQIKKIQEELEQRNPFRDLLPNLREYIDYLKVKNDLESQYESSVDRESLLEANVREQSSLVALREEEYNNAVKLYGVNSSQAEEAELRLKLSKDILNVSETELKSQQKKTNEISKQIKEGESLRVKTTNAFKEASNYAGAITSGFSDISNMLSNWGVEIDETFMNVLDGFNQVYEGLEKIDLTRPFTIISGVVSAFAGIGNVFASLFNIGDKKKEREIQRQIEAVERLEKSYEKLEQAMDDALSAKSMNKNYEGLIDNLEEQIEARKKMIKAEEDKKKSDKERIEGWYDEIDELEKKKQEERTEYLQSLGGFGDNASIKSAAEEFVSAWLDAFEETGDGLTALEGKWDDYIKNIIMKQAALSTIDKYLKPIFDMVDESLEDGEFSIPEFEDIMKEAEKISPMLNEFLKSLFKGFGFEGGVGQTGELSSLSKGIQQITAEQADALTALLSSMRFFVADSNTQLKSLLASLTSQDAIQNPILAELKLQTKLVSSINSMFASVIVSAGHANGGKSLKVTL